MKYLRVGVVARLCSVAQSNPTLCGPVDKSPPGFSVHVFSKPEYWSGLPLPSPEPSLQRTKLTILKYK